MLCRRMPAFVHRFPWMPLKSRYRSMASQTPSTRANIAVALAIMLWSVSTLSSFTRHIHFSGPPQSIANKYEATSYCGLYDGPQTTFISTVVKLDITHIVFL